VIGLQTPELATVFCIPQKDSMLARDCGQGTAIRAQSYAYAVKTYGVMTLLQNSN
jgi:hypothetical protein